MPATSSSEQYRPARRPSPYVGESAILPYLDSLEAIVSAAVALGAEDVAGWSPAESQLLAQTQRVPVPLADLRGLVREGFDPLGAAYSHLKSSEERRGLGQTYTPPQIVASMLDWSEDMTNPSRVVDPGSGSGRFTVAAGRRFSKAHLIASDIDPLATLMTRGNLAAAGMARRSTVLLADYRTLPIDPIRGTTLYVGNPPYVRHHQISPQWKEWLLETARQRGHAASGLAGLHVYFFLATAERGQPGDVGAFITSAEWLDVNYGSLVRQLLLDGLGGLSVHVLDPDAAPFADAATTGVITTFCLGSKPKSMRLRRVRTVGDLGALEGGRLVSRERLAEAKRWTPLTRVTPKLPDGWIELGELCRVHRGAVTGANSVWVTHAENTQLPSEVLFRSVTKARELFAAGSSLDSDDHLRYVIDLPADLDVFDTEVRRRVERFLRQAKRNGVADGYIAQSRRAWWKVGLREPAPILATYMARRPPAFVRNLARARHINVAHGLYPRQPMENKILDELARSLRESVVVGQGRTYAGGLTKFEPKEMERVPVPNLDLLAARA